MATLLIGYCVDDSYIPVSLSEVTIIDTSNKEIAIWKKSSEGSGVEKQVYEWMEKRVSDVGGVKGVCIIGYDVDFFLRVMSQRCIFDGCRVPLNWWYPSTCFKKYDLKDIFHGVSSDDFPKYIDGLRSKALKEQEGKWNDRFLNWKGFGDNSGEDVWMLSYLAARMGILQEAARQK